MLFIFFFFFLWLEQRTPPPDKSSSIYVYPLPRSSIQNEKRILESQTFPTSTTTFEDFFFFGMNGARSQHKCLLGEIWPPFFVSNRSRSDHTLPLYLKGFIVRWVTTLLFFAFPFSIVSRQLVGIDIFSFPGARSISPGALILARQPTKFPSCPHVVPVDL